MFVCLFICLFAYISLCLSIAAIRPELEASGGIFVDIPNTEATVDGNLVTGVDWAGQGEVVKKFAELFGVKITG